MKRIWSVLLLMLWMCCGCVPEEFMLRVEKDNPSPLTVAAMLPLTGSNRIYAERMREGLLFAASEINANGGVGGKTLQLQFIDTCGSAAGTRAAGDKALAAKAVALIAGYNTTEVSRIIEYSSQLRMPTIIPLATSNYHLEVSPFVYRNSYSDGQQMEVLAAYIYHWRMLKRGAVLIDPVGDSEYSRGIARNFSQGVVDAGGEIVHTVILPEDGKLPVNIFRDLLVADPQFVLVPSSGARAAEILKILRKSGFNGIICGPDSWDDHRFMDALLDCEPGDCLYTAFFYEGNQTPEFINFKKGFRQRFYHNPGAVETQSYDALKFLAIGLTGVDNLLDFDKNWRAIRSHRGAAATYTMLKKGKIDRTVYINSIGVRRGAEHIVPYGRLSHKLQYSKLEDYQVTESDEL